MFLYNSCKSQFTNTGEIGQRGPQQMTLEGFYDLTSGYTDCILNSSLYEASVTIGDNTNTNIFYSSNDLYDVPSDELWAQVVSGMILEQEGIADVTYDLGANLFTITTQCGYEDTFQSKPLINKLNIYYDISCVQCEPPIYYFSNCDDATLIYSNDVTDITSGKTYIFQEIESCWTSCGTTTTYDTLTTLTVNSEYEDCAACDPAVDYFVECGIPNTCPPETVNFGPSNDPTTIFNGWNRFAFLATQRIYQTATSALRQLNTGLQPDGTITSNDPTTYFYTGATNARYLGVRNSTNLPGNVLMQEGQNVGPSTVNSSMTAAGQFYYNSDINKFVLAGNLANSQYAWFTYNPTQDVTGQGYPTTTWQLTNPTQWQLQNFNGTPNRLTINGPSNTVVNYVTKINQAGGVPNALVCNLNSSSPNGFYSPCTYNDYTHEITLGSSAADDDYIGIVLALNHGKGTNPNATDTLMLIFSNNLENYPIDYPNPTLGPRVQVHYNYAQTIYGFTDGTNYSTFVMTGATSPFSAGNYNNQGQIRVKIDRTGTIFNIYSTSRLGVDVGLNGTAPYNLLYTFDLSDSSTWNAAPTYAVGDELLKFSAGTHIGYMTYSQQNTYFYDFAFSGVQLPSNAIYVNPTAGLTLGSVHRFNEIDGCWTYSGTTDVYDVVNPYTISSTFDSCSGCTQQCSQYLGHDEPWIGCTDLSVEFFVTLSGPVGCINGDGGNNSNCPQATVQYTINGNTSVMNSYIWSDSTDGPPYQIEPNCGNTLIIDTVIPNTNVYDQQTITIDYVITYPTPEGAFTFTETIEVYIPGC